MADAKLLSRFSRSRYEPPINKMFDRIGHHLSQTEIKLLMLVSGRKLEHSVQRKIKTGKDFFQALANKGCCDESNFYSIMDMMKTINRYDLLHMFHLRQKAKVALDPVEEYLKNISRLPQHVDPVANCSTCSQTLRISGRDKISETGNSTAQEDRLSFPESMPPSSKRLRRSQRISTRVVAKNEPDVPPGLRQKYTCDVRLRVRAEYCNYETVLQGNVSSMKPDPIERQLDCFTQASAILRTRDLGFIVCDIKFSEITYLDAFWRDYLNGSLLEALKGVFITESLKQAVGNEAIKLLVNVDEHDYEKGRSILMNNLHQSL